jgi:2TM domain-containing protein
VVPVETLTRNERAASERLPELSQAETRDGLRAQAIQQIQRGRRFKVHLVAFALGIPVLGVVWVLTEYYEEHTWPSRFASDPDVAGTWDPWFLFVAGIWAVVLAIHALERYVGPSVGRYVRRPPTRAEVDREVERLKSRR